MQLVFSRSIQIGTLKLEIYHTPEEDIYSVWFPEDSTLYPWCFLKTIEKCYLMILDIVVPYYLNNPAKYNGNTLITLCKEWIESEDP